MLNQLPSELLLLVAEFCDDQTCQSLIRVNERCKETITKLLYRAARLRDPSVVGWVIRYYEQECDILKFLENTRAYGLDYSKSENHKGITANPLFAAVSRGLQKVVLFLAQSVGLPLQDETLVQEAIEEGHIDILRILIYNGASLELELRGTHALHSAAIAGHKDTVRFLVQNLKNDINLPDRDGHTPLSCLCAATGHPRVRRIMAAYLLKLGAAVDVEEMEDHRRPLPCAIASGYFRIASMLLEEGANITEAASVNVGKMLNQDIEKLLDLDETAIPDERIKHRVSFLQTFGNRLEGDAYDDLVSKITAFLSRLEKCSYERMLGKAGVAWLG